MNEMAHIGHYVLANADSKFSKFKSGPGKERSKKDKTKVFDKKKGRDFWQSTDESGNVSSMGFKGPAAICADGAPKKIAGDTYQPTTSFKFNDGNYINADTIPYVVLPQTKNASGKWASAHNVKGNPFGDAGIKPGDYVKLTNPQNGKSVYAIWGENGPSGEVGEISMAAARELGLNPSPINGGFTTMTDSQYLDYEFFPGSGKRDGSRIEAQTAEEIQTNGRNAWAARSVSGGFVILSGKDSVLVGVQQMPAAYADPFCVHVGGCPLLLGSDSVFIDNRPAVRVGDSCTCGQKVVSGEGTVLVYGNPTSEGTQAPAVSPFSLWGIRPDQGLSFLENPFEPPAWAKDVLGPGATWPGMTPAPTGTDLLQMSAGSLFGP
ncbi:MAG: PAAR domain-containing protein [Polyangiaceae bacterium]